MPVNEGDPMSEVAASYGALAGEETANPEEACADRTGEYPPTRLARPLAADAEPR